MSPKKNQKKLGGNKTNKDVLVGKWKQVRGEGKQWWGKLTDDDLERAAGKFDVLTGLLQEKYGYTRAEAVQEIDKRLSRLPGDLTTDAPPPKPKEK